jgi:hypothetical protein
VEVAPAGREDEADEADRDREPADNLSGTAAERRQSADEQGEPADRATASPTSASRIPVWVLIVIASVSMAR